jgi:GAF domain-containing protein
MSIETLMASLVLPGQPDILFAALQAECERLVGVDLFTLLIKDAEAVARIYSNRPDEYPVFGQKLMGPTPWGDHVLKRQLPYLGRDIAGIRWAFPDAPLIESMGLGSVINLPVIYDGETIGTMNLLAPEHHYSAEHLQRVTPLAPLLIPAFLTARAKTTKQA